MLTVVEARVVEPVFTKFADVRLPEIVEDPEFKEVSATLPAEIFPRVVEARVVEAVTSKLTDVVNPEVLVVVALVVEE